MKKYITYIIAVFFLLTGAESCIAPIKENGTRRTSDFNWDWKFALLNDTETFDDIKSEPDWKAVRLPHDWSVEHAFDSINGDGATAYLPGGRGTYKKVFNLDTNSDQTTYIYFDGVYNHAEVWLNGKKLGYHPNGYSPFYFDISEYINDSGKDNEIEVRVDRSRYIDSRWYPGSGIYRNVKLVQTDNLHIPVWGTFVTTPVITKNSAEVHIEVSVKNNYSDQQNFQIITSIEDQSRKEIAKVASKESLGSRSENKLVQKVTVQNPELWDIDSPVMYTAISTLVKDGKVVDTYETRFGIRDFYFDKDKGFFLNGKNMLIKGVCMHHDGGLVGAAVPKGVWERRFAKLKDAGCNAIRVAHNPASEEFLELCDEMGFLVQEEFFDEWDNPKDKRLNQQERHDDYISRGYADNFQEWAEIDLKSTMLRSRNHPSIFQWSIGNEIEWTYPRYAHSSGFFNMSWDGNYFWEEPPISTSQIKERYDEYGDEKYVLSNTAHKLAGWTRELDTTRPVVANCILPSVSHESGYADALDVVGYSYRRIMYDYGHKNYPDKVIMGTENLPQWHEWKSVEEREHISGTFLWTGIDYMGEAHDGWPRKGVASGLIDLAGFEKPVFHMYKTLWQSNPHVYIATQTLERSIFEIDETTGMPVEKVPGAWKQRLWTWHDVNEHWNYREGALVIVEVYSNCDEVELFLNNESLGIRKLADAEDRMLKWAVPFQPGALRAVGKNGDNSVSVVIETASDPVSIELKADKNTILADGYDVAHIVAQLIDKNGNPVKHVDRQVKFEVEGDVRILGVDNGEIANIQGFQSDNLLTSKGGALMIIQSLGVASDVKVKAHSDELKSNVLMINNSLNK